MRRQWAETTTRNFSNGKAVDAIETEKSRIILHELEPDWWILAVCISAKTPPAFLIYFTQSVDLTRLPSSSEATAHKSQKSPISVEYSAREVCPPALLLQQILRAHQIFLLHQAPSIADLFARIPRPKFYGFLKRFWDGFVWNWDVLLHGNPAVDIFNGLKLAAGGELGIGEGEEEWGSGEREVLEGFIERTGGLVDLVVSRFGDGTPSSRTPSITSSSARPSPKEIGLDWQVSGRYPRPSDGVIFSGIGALTRRSVRNISSWTERLYMFDQDAYGVRDNPSSAPRRKRRKIESSPERARSRKTLGRPQNVSSSESSQGKGLGGTYNRPNETPTGIPPPIVAPERMLPAKDRTSGAPDGQSSIDPVKKETEGIPEDSTSGTETLMKYLTLGVYGSTWGIPSGRPPVSRRLSDLRKDEGGKSTPPVSFDKGKVQEPNAAPGYFLIGLQGQLEEDLQVTYDEEDTELGTDRETASEEHGNSINRVMMRTLHVERAKRKSGESGENPVEDGEVTEEPYYDRLRVVVYVQTPFIFTFVFELQTDALAMPSFYRSLHHQLGPLQRPLLASTSPGKVSARIWEAAAHKSTASTRSTQPIWDLVYDPARETIHTTLPNIPEPGPTAPDNSKSEVPPWTRIEALGVHSQVLNTYTSTRRQRSEIERTCKTSRGWWVVWMRLPNGPVTQNTDANTFREAFLIRKASDYVAPAARKSSGRLGRDVSGSSASGGWGPGKLAEGIGIDARQYIEGILSLNR